MKPYLRIIGDIHNKRDIHHRLARKAEYSIQVGDLGGYTHLTALDPTKHKFIGGNHENYHFLLGADSPPHNLGNYGIYQIPGYKIFFVRGAWSIDWKQQMMRGHFSPEEELSYGVLLEVVEYYKSEKPDYVITHEAPFSLLPYLTSMEFAAAFGLLDPHVKTKTNMALQSMFEEHQPKWWCFGHYHKNWSKEINGTVFYCVNQYKCLDFPKQGV